MHKTKHYGLLFLGGSLFALLSSLEVASDVELHEEDKIRAVHDCSTNDQLDGLLGRARTWTILIKA